ncbi:MAG TPA: TIGR03960 family B12-binding radical SAM protein [Thermodesulfobacteriota bacterium]|nr:TIGR03960 family B12-binding radical SAM protein [Thermodesulfobacteriota bacterium]
MVNDLKITDYLPLVQRPSRYIGGEINSVRKDLSSVRLKFGLSFPDAYEVGMSHLGLQILYQILNSREDIACERVFAPFSDMEALLLEKDMPLSTLESGIALNELDIMGFSLQYELTYTNVLNMLSLGKIPLYANQRGIAHPIVIGGGPCAFNPEPVADFFDCFLLGDGEEAILEICDAVIDGKRRHLDRKKILENLCSIEGVYVPSFFKISYNDDSTVKKIEPLIAGLERVKKRNINDLNKLPLPVRPVVPFAETVHDRLSVEIARGCVRGCRFCQAGMLKRPIREREPGNIMELVREALKTTGYEEVSLLSLSSGDYSRIEGVLSCLTAELEDRKIALSLPSLRVGTLSPAMASEIKKVRKTGFTFAPEAGTERLRAIINKGMDEKALLCEAEDVFKLGWRKIKLYFMFGLPGEKDEDIVEIPRLSKAVRDTGRRITGKNPEVNASVAAFIPKPFTPFQWEPQLSLEESARRLSIIKKEAKRLGLSLRWHDTRMSFIEGVFSRGDRLLSGVIHRAFKKGARFDGWGDLFRGELWNEAFKEEGIDPSFYTERRRAPQEILPWDHLDCGVTKEYLLKEYENSIKMSETPDCRAKKCTDCGVCDFRAVKNVISKENAPEENRTGRRPSFSGEKGGWVRLCFSKTDNLKYLSHLEMIKAVSRALRRAGIPLRYSGGFHPLPRIVFSEALPLGIESIDEYMDIEVMDETYAEKPDGLISVLNASLPCGLRILRAESIPLQLPSLSAMIKAQKYLVFLKNGPLGLDIEPQKIEDMVRDFLQMDSISVEIKREGKTRIVDIRPLLSELALAGGSTLAFTLCKREGGGCRPGTVISRLFGLSPEKASLIPILKVKTVLKS